ncbi:dsp1-1-like protein [Cordyceps javanica]|uniref:Dsp1-1-like protein n=1 Tax=Cordyceps javanica TaxID=43265 RepID=A0A545V8T2_9HYPO|nr:dsp1-1-like protein [Cordyceps javanica]
MRTCWTPLLLSSSSSTTLFTHPTLDELHLPSIACFTLAPSLNTHSHYQSHSIQPHSPWPWTIQTATASAQLSIRTPYQAFECSPFLATILTTYSDQPASEFPLGTPYVSTHPSSTQLTQIGHHGNLTTMPHRLDTHVLTVDANVIHKVDTANPANLYSMWTVFSRCADSLEQGRRLENLSWRLWQREQLVENEKRLDASATTTTNTNTSPLATTWRPQDLPQLSGSVDSLADEDATEFVSESAPLEIIRPRIRCLDSTSSRSRRDRHISSDDFKQMVVSIVNDTAPLSAPTTTSPLTTLKKEMAPVAPAQIAAQPLTSMATEPKPALDTHVRTTPEEPVRESFPQPSRAGADEATIPEPEAAPAHQPVTQKKAPAKFALGGSCSSSEQGMSVELSKPSLAPPPKKAMFQIGGSSESASTKSSIQPAKVFVPQKMKQPVIPTSRNPQLEAESAIDSDTEDDYVDESAIDDDDDSSDWEDSMEDSGKSSVDDKFFQRVESKANLVSRPSLITLMLAQNERQKNLSNQASHSASAIIRSRAGPSAPTLGVSPNDSDEGPLMMKGMRPSNLRPIIEVPRSSAQPIVAPANHIHAQAALSPRTTRRNMLATELTESLRRHLLWERQQKTSTANAVLKRRHTSHDVANLRQFPEKPCLKQSEDANANSWNQYLNNQAFDGYHSKGW